MLRVAVELARRERRPQLVARYRKTERNGACLQVLSQLARPSELDPALFVWDTGSPPAPFGGVRIRGVVSAE